MASCMGGWCKVREICPAYLFRVGEPSHRNLCFRGEEYPQVAALRGPMPRVLRLVASQPEQQPEPEELEAA